MVHILIHLPYKTTKCCLGKYTPNIPVPWMVCDNAHGHIKPLHLNHVTSLVADDDQLHILLAGIENDLPCLKMWRGKFLIAKLCNFDLGLFFRE